MPVSTQSTRQRPAPEPVDKATVPVRAEIGTTGLKHQAGVIQEEWVRALDGMQGVKKYEEMALDPVVGTLLWAVSTELRRVKVNVDPADETPAAEEAAGFVDECMGDMSHTWEDFVAEVLTMLQFGWSYHEIVYKVRRGHVPGRPGESSKYSDGRIGWRKLPIRAQETLSRWLIDDEGGIAGMVQTDADTGEVAIPIEKAALFRPAAHKGNPQGRSMLRNAYPAWYVRKRLEELEAIGAERDLVGIPKIGVPADWLGPTATADQQAAVAAFRTIGEQARRNEQACLVWPRKLDANGNELITFELMAAPGERQVDLGPIVQRYDTKILMTMLADVILIGHTETGAYALASQKYRAFERGLEAIMRSIAAVFNRHVIPRLLQLNGMDPTLSPEIVFEDIEDVDLDVLGKYLAALSAAGVSLTPNEELEAWLFQVAGMPWTPPDERPEPPAPPAPPPVMAPPAPPAAGAGEPGEQIDTGDQPAGQGTPAARA